MTGLLFLHCHNYVLQGIYHEDLVVLSYIDISSLCYAYIAPILLWNPASALHKIRLFVIDLTSNPGLKVQVYWLLDILYLASHSRQILLLSLWVMEYRITSVEQSKSIPCNFCTWIPGDKSILLFQFTILAFPRCIELILTKWFTSWIDEKLVQFFIVWYACLMILCRAEVWDWNLAHLFVQHSSEGVR